MELFLYFSAIVACNTTHSVHHSNGMHQRGEAIPVHLCLTGGHTAHSRGGVLVQLFTVIQCYVHCCDPTCTALISVQVLTESIMCTLCTLLPKSIMCIVHTAKSIMCIDFCSVFLERLESNCGFLPYHQSDLSQHCPCESY